MTKYSFVFFSIVLIISCSKPKDETPKPQETINTYFTLKANEVRYYTADSVVYNDFTQQIDSTRFLLKDTVLEANDNVYTIERYKKLKADTTWQIWKRYTVSNFFARVEQTIDNIRTIVLINPVQSNTTWKGNYTNDAIFHYKSIDTTENIAGKVYEHTTTVVQEKYNDLITSRNEYEKYAKNIGLVQILRENLSKDFNTGQITSGYRYRQTILPQ